MEDALGTRERGLVGALDDVLDQVADGVASRTADLQAVHPRFATSADNLVHYLAFREIELRSLQLRLQRAGLSSLGRAEGHVMASLNATRRAAVILAGGDPGDLPAPADERAFCEARCRLAANTGTLLGPVPPGRTTRIMVTMPSEAADDPSTAGVMVAAGMDVARINLAHDDEDAWTRMVRHIRDASMAAGRAIRVVADLPGPKLRTGDVAAGEDGRPVRIRVHAGDHLLLVASPEPGVPARLRKDGSVGTPAVISCTLPEVLREVAAGQQVFIDDGRIAAVVEAASPEGLRLRVTAAGPKGHRVKAGKGINLPETHLPVSCLTAADLDLLPFVAANVDAVQMSFVQDPADVRALRDLLRRLGREDLGIVLKVETARAFEALPQLVLAGMEGPAVGVMIARGDLAVEVGYERLAEVQEEILWLCEAAHVPVIWATEVLDNLAHTGRVTRAEVTDAAMGVRAECVMLNKGSHIVDAIRVLDGILTRMQAHVTKKTPLLRPLASWQRHPSAPGRE